MLKEWRKNMKERDAVRKTAYQAVRNERRVAAAAIVWPGNTPYLLNPDPVQRKALKRAAIVIGAAVALWIFAPDVAKDIAKKVDAKEAQALRPAMEKQLQAGNASAGVWLATHYPKDYRGLLQKEADAGEPTAMFVVGRAMVLNPSAFRWDSRADARPDSSIRQIGVNGLDLVRRAAHAGNLDAMTFAMQHGGL